MKYFYIHYVCFKFYFKLMLTSQKLCSQYTHNKLVIFVIFANVHMAHFTLHMLCIVKLFVQFNFFIMLQCSDYFYLNFYIKYCILFVIHQS